MEHFFTCQYCWERISMVLESDEEGGATNYVEDCEICCRPIELSFVIEDDLIVRFDAKRMEGI